MGKAVRHAVEGATDVQFAGMWQRGESLDAIVGAADVLIDFSLPEANPDVLQSVATHAIPLVCGVSGLGDRQMAEIRSLATTVPIVFDRNMSQGVAVLDKLVEQAARSLDDGFSVEIHEVHHVHKVDSPSGTALALGETVAAARNAKHAEDIVRYQAERRGEVPGEHTVRFTSETETLTLHHSVTTRAVFAEGAVRAARWVVGQKPGLYGMKDVLFGGG